MPSPENPENFLHVHLEMAHFGGISDVNFNDFWHLVGVWSLTPTPPPLNPPRIGIWIQPVRQDQMKPASWRQQAQLIRHNYSLVKTTLTSAYFTRYTHSGRLFVYVSHYALLASRARLRLSASQTFVLFQPAHLGFQTSAHPVSS